jgi:hypothetical protein
LIGRENRGLASAQVGQAGQAFEFLFVGEELVTRDSHAAQVAAMAAEHAVEQVVEPVLGAVRGRENFRDTHTAAFDHRPELVGFIRAVADQMNHLRPDSMHLFEAAIHGPNFEGLEARKQDRKGFNFAIELKYHYRSERGKPRKMGRWWMLPWCASVV